VIECHGKDACKDGTVTCPPGMPCRVECLGEASCKTATLQCNQAHACDIVCEGKDACQDGYFNCGGGVCDVVCQGDPDDTCKHSTLTCGTDDSSITCNATNDNPDILDPTVDCACEEIGC
jgi:hypothetical protein